MREIATPFIQIWSVSLLFSLWYIADNAIHRAIFGFERLVSSLSHLALACFVDQLRRLLFCALLWQI